MPKQSKSSSPRHGGRKVGHRASRQRHTHASGHRAASSAANKRWSARVTAKSDAMDLESDIFKQDSAEAIAQSLKRSASQSRRRKGSAFQSAMSMLNFYINRAGRNLPATRKKTLNQAKTHLRRAFGRDSGKHRSS